MGKSMCFCVGKERVRNTCWLDTCYMVGNTGTVGSPRDPLCPRSGPHPSKLAATCMWASHHACELPAMNGFPIMYQVSGTQVSRYSGIQVSRYPVTRCPHVQMSTYQVSDNRYHTSDIKYQKKDVTKTETYFHKKSNMSSNE